MNTNDKLLNKIQALLNKAGDRGVTPEESQAFFAKAHELLAKHGLTTSDLSSMAKNEDGSTDFGIKHESVDTGRKKHEADDYIWPILNRCYGVRTLFTTNWNTGTHAWILVGDPTQIQLAELAAEVLYKVMTTNVRKYIKDHGLEKSARIKRSYFSGVKTGYLQKVQEAEAAAYAEATAGQRDAYDLVLVGKSEVIELYSQDKLNPKSVKSKVRMSLDSEAYFRGMETGLNLDLNSANKISSK